MKERTSGVESSASDADLAGPGCIGGGCWSRVTFIVIALAQKRDVEVVTREPAHVSREEARGKTAPRDPCSHITTTIPTYTVLSVNHGFGPLSSDRTYRISDTPERRVPCGAE